MKERTEGWKKNLEKGASEVFEPSAKEIDAAVHAVAGQMGDAESMVTKEPPIEAAREQLEAEGWRYRGPVSAEEVNKAVAIEGREIKIVEIAAQRFIFEKDKEP